MEQHISRDKSSKVTAVTFNGSNSEIKNSISPNVAEFSFNRTINQDSMIKASSKQNSLMPSTVSNESNEMMDGVNPRPEM